jgi:hypothetical protein
MRTHCWKALQHVWYSRAHLHLVCPAWGLNSRQQAGGFLCHSAHALPLPAACTAGHNMGAPSPRAHVLTRLCEHVQHRTRHTHAAHALTLRACGCARRTRRTHAGHIHHTCSTCIVLAVCSRPLQLQFRRHEVCCKVPAECGIVGSQSCPVALCHGNVREWACSVESGRVWLHHAVSWPPVLPVFVQRFASGVMFR